MDNWTTVARRNEVEPEQPLSVSVGGCPIGVHDVDGTLHAIEDTCPHANALLTQGFVEGCEVECPLHNAVFDIPSGKYLRGEPCRDLKVFPIRVVGDEIQVNTATA